MKPSDHTAARGRPARLPQRCPMRALISSRKRAWSALSSRPAACRSSSCLERRGERAGAGALLRRRRPAPAARRARRSRSWPRPARALVGVVDRAGADVARRRGRRRRPLARGSRRRPSRRGRRCRPGGGRVTPRAGRGDPADQPSAGRSISSTARGDVAGRPGRSCRRLGIAAESAAPPAAVKAMPSASAPERRAARARAVHEDHRRDRDHDEARRRRSRRPSSPGLGRAGELLVARACRGCARPARACTRRPRRPPPTRAVIPSSDVSQYLTAGTSGCGRRRCRRGGCSRRSAAPGRR